MAAITEVSHHALRLMKSCNFFAALAVRKYEVLDYERF